MLLLPYLIFEVAVSAKGEKKLGLMIWIVLISSKWIYIFYEVIHSFKNVYYDKPLSAKYSCRH